MSKICQISGKRAMFGNNVSKAINKTKRRFEVNLISKKFFLPSQNKLINLKVSARTLKTINKKIIRFVRSYNKPLDGVFDIHNWKELIPLLNSF